MDIKTIVETLMPNKDKADDIKRNIAELKLKIKQVKDDLQGLAIKQDALASEFAGLESVYGAFKDGKNSNEDMQEIHKHNVVLNLAVLEKEKQLRSLERKVKEANDEYVKVYGSELLKSVDKELRKLDKLNKDNIERYNAKQEKAEELARETRRLQQELAQLTQEHGQSSSLTQEVRRKIYKLLALFHDELGFIPPEYVGYADTQLLQRINNKV